MLKILIVEGNTPDLIIKSRQTGRQLGSERYRDSLALNAPDAIFATSMPLAQDLQEDHIDLSAFDCFALTGSGFPWSAGDPEVKPYMDHLEKIIAQKKPIIGSCWGMQSIVQIMGGNSEPNTKGTEIGLAEDITLTEAGREHWVFDEMPEQFSSPCIHRDHVVALPDCFELLASNAVSRVQAVACTSDELDYVGFQFHPEFDLNYVHTFYKNSHMQTSEENMIASFPENPPAIVSNPLQRTRVFGNWLSYVESKKAAVEAAA